MILDWSAKFTRDRQQQVGVSGDRHTFFFGRHSNFRRNASAQFDHEIPTGEFYPSRMATARVQPAEARSIFTGKHDTMNPVDGSCSRLCNFSMWQ